ncbi:MAG: PLP-dependent aminotransferase family protein [Actinobacteria bacterium]|nr:MAG: PLP-dependent aminotransferase family protein [Actinomycetota bacterium]
MSTISFARGVPAPECLPIEDLADCARTAIERDGAAALLYGHTLGYQPLREWLGERHDVEPARVIVTNGSLQAFHFVLSALAGAGRVIVERPTYDRPRRILSSFDEVAVDDEGLDLGELERVLAAGGPPAFLYTIPTFQNPTGVTLAPGIRVGYIVVPEAMAAGLEETVASTYITPALIGQATVLEFLRRGLLDPNLERVGELLRARRDAMLAALERELGGRARWSRPEGGYFLWLELAEGTDATELLLRATSAGVTFVPGPDFGGEPNSVRLAFSFASPDEIDEGISRLATALEPVSEGRAGIGVAARV